MKGNFCVGKNGFTLVELLVVIAVLGVLAGGVLVAINPLKRISQANDSKVKSDIGQITNAMQAYYVTHQYYPATVGELVTSGDLKTEPKPPSAASYTNYLIASDASVTAGCSIGNALTSQYCADVTINVPLTAPQTTGATWQWNSTTGQVGEYVAPTPTVTPLPTNTPTPTATPTNTPTPTPDPGLLGHWKFDEGSGTVVSDSTSFTHPGTWSVSSGQWTTSMSSYGNAGNFTSTANVNMGNNLNITGGLTVSAWVKRADATSTRIIVIKGQQYGNTLNYALLIDAANHVQLQLGTASGIQYIAMSGTLTDTTSWHYIAGTYSTSGVANLYIDNMTTPVTTVTSLPTSLSTVTNNFTISGAQPWNGTIDDVRIYNYPRSSSQLTTDMASQ